MIIVTRVIKDTRVLIEVNASWDLNSKGTLALDGKYVATLIGRAKVPVPGWFDTPEAAIEKADSYLTKFYDLLPL